MKKMLKKIISLTLILMCSVYLFSGCTFKKYELIGIVNQGDTKITPLSEITDEETIEYLADNYNSYASIDLKSNGKFVMEYSLSETGLTITYSQTGSYKLNEKENTITFYTPKSDGTERSTTQQYTKGSIIYYDGVYFLAFK